MQMERERGTDGTLYSLSFRDFSYVCISVDQGNNTFERVEHVVFESSGAAEKFGVEDPRIVYIESEATYYMFYSAVEQDQSTKQQIISRLSLATTTDITQPKWKRYEGIIPNMNGSAGWSKSGALMQFDTNIQGER